MRQAEYDKFQEYVLEIGKRVVMCGTEVRPVEDTIIRICRVYGIKSLRDICYYNFNCYDNKRERRKALYSISSN